MSPWKTKINAFEDNSLENSHEYLQELQVTGKKGRFRDCILKVAWFTAKQQEFQAAFWQEVITLVRPNISTPDFIGDATTFQQEQKYFNWMLTKICMTVCMISKANYKIRSRELEKNSSWEIIIWERTERKNNKSTDKNIQTIGFNCKPSKWNDWQKKRMSCAKN